jgi:hypothetical protein
MRSTSDEAVHSKSDDLDADSIGRHHPHHHHHGGGAGGGVGGGGGRGRTASPPLYKPRPMRFPPALSPQSPPSEESSYQVGIGLISNSV